MVVVIVAGRCGGRPHCRSVVVEVDGSVLSTTGHMCASPSFPALLRQWAIHCRSFLSAMRILCSPHRITSHRFAGYINELKTVVSAEYGDDLFDKLPLPDGSVYNVALDVEGANRFVWQRCLLLAVVKIALVGVRL